MAKQFGPCENNIWVKNTSAAFFRIVSRLVGAGFWMKLDRISILQYFQGRIFAQHWRELKPLINKSRSKFEGCGSSSRPVIETTVTSHLPTEQIKGTSILKLRQNGQLLLTGPAVYDPFCSNSSLRQKLRNGLFQWKCPTWFFNWLQANSDWPSQKDIKSSAARVPSLDEGVIRR